MDLSHEEALDVGVARVAIRLVWTATLRAPEAVFADSRIVWGADAASGVLDENEAAKRLAALPRPLILRGEVHSTTQLQLIVDAAHLARSPGEQMPRALTFLNEMGDRPILVLSAGRAYRLSPDAVRHLVADYRFAVPLGGGGGPPEDPWTLQLQLPASWLAGCGFVWLAGRNGGNSMHAPMRTGDGWSEHQLLTV